MPQKSENADEENVVFSLKLVDDPDPQTGRIHLLQRTDTSH